MPVINPAQIQKYTAFGAPYVSATHNCQEDKAHCRSGPLCGLEIEESGGNLVVQPGRFMINGISVDITTAQTLTIPGFSAPYILYAYTADEVPASNVTLDFTDAAGLSASYVPIAEKTTNGQWRSFPYISEDFIVANTQGGIRHRTTHLMTGGETAVNIAQPLGISDQIHSGLIVFLDGVLQQLTTDYTRNGMKGITIAAAGAGELYHLFISDDIEWVETVSGVGALTLAKPYNPNHHDLWVFRVGQGKQRLTSHYTETDVNTITVVNNATYVCIKFKHNFWREVITLSGATTDLDFENVYDASRADISVFHAANSSAAGILLNQGSAHDYAELSGESISLQSGELYGGGGAGQIIEVYRHRTGIPKGMGYIMAEDFQLGSAGADIYAKVSAADTTTDYLNSKVTVSGGLVKTITSPGANEKLNIDASGVGGGTDINTKVTAADTTTDYLNSKIAVLGGLVKTVLNPGGNEQLQIDATGLGGSDTQVKVSAADTTTDYLNSKIAVIGGLTKSIINPAGDEQVQIDGSGISGNIQNMNQKFWTDQNFDIFRAGSFSSDGYWRSVLVDDSINWLDRLIMARGYLHYSAGSSPVTGDFWDITDTALSNYWQQNTPFYFPIPPLHHFMGRASNVSHPADPAYLEASLYTRDGNPVADSGESGLIIGNGPYIVFAALNGTILSNIYLYVNSSGELRLAFNGPTGTPTQFDMYVRFRLDFLNIWYTDDLGHYA